MMCVWQRASVHHVRARSLPFECGDDDYLFIIIVGVSVMRAAALPLPRLLPPLPPLTPRSSRSHTHITHTVCCLCILRVYCSCMWTLPDYLWRWQVVEIAAFCERLWSGYSQQGWRMTRAILTVASDSCLNRLCTAFPGDQTHHSLTGHRCVRCHQVTAGT